MLGSKRQTRLVLAFIALAIPVSSCLKFGGQSKSGSKKIGSNFELVYFTQNPFANNKNLGQATTSAIEQIQLAQGVSRGVNEDSIWAMAGCQCTPGFDGHYLRLLTQSRGALPQALVPTVRDEIRNKPILKALFSLGSSGLSNIANLFIKDEKINNEVRKGIGEKLRNSLPGGTNVADELQIYFDLYPNPYSNLGDKNAFTPKSMSIAQQSSKWAYIMSIDNMWGNNPARQQPVATNDHGLQLLATALTISEWTYAFGLDPVKSNHVYGGLTIDPAMGLRSALKPFDARKSTTGSGIITGSYAINFPTSGTLDLAINVKETWTRTGDAVYLSEQARVWTSAAMAYQRMRPASRQASVHQVFSANGIFPDDAHLLPLSFLPGLAALLDGPFVNTKDYLVRESALIKDAAIVDERQTASLLGVTRLARALLSWNLAVQTTEQDRLPTSVAAQIQASKPKLKDSLRLAIQTILDQYVVTVSPTSRLRSIGMVQSLSNQIKPDMATVAEVLTVLAAADQMVFSSNETQTDFQKKLIGLFHWFAADYLADLANSNSGVMNTPQAALWTRAALNQLTKYPPQISQAPWLNDALSNVNDAIKAWDARYTR